MQADFELFLVLASLLTGILLMADVFYFAKKRVADSEMPKIFEYAHAFFPVLVIVLLLRSFVIEPFRIPTGSLKPSLLPGDFIAANKFSYGLRLPVSHVKILDISAPQKGDIVVFRWPVDPKLDFIKRTIGTPGDKITYKNKVLYINDIRQPQVKLGTVIDYDESGNEIKLDKYQETINHVTHDIYQDPNKPAEDFTVLVPENSYFMMGDNRDGSDDSRYWGFVPEANLVGKAILIWLSWDQYSHDFLNKIRWSRIGNRINQ